MAYTSSTGESLYKQIILLFQYNLDFVDFWYHMIFEDLITELI